MPLAPGEKYAGTVKKKAGQFRRAVVGPRGTIRRWELFDGEGNEVGPKPHLETVSQPAEGEGEPMAKPKGAPAAAGEAEGAGEGAAERRWWPWVVGAGVLIVGAAVGAALWTRRAPTDPGQPRSIFGRLKAVA